MSRFSRFPARPAFAALLLVLLIAGASAAGEFGTVVFAAGLKVQSTPPGASVTLDGISAGTTPTDLMPVIPAHQYTIVLKLDGYQDFSTTVTLSNQESRTVSYAMIPDSNPFIAGVSGDPVVTTPVPVLQIEREIAAATTTEKIPVQRRNTTLVPVASLPPSPTMIPATPATSAGPVLSATPAATIVPTPGLQNASTSLARAEPVDPVPDLPLSTLLPRWLLPILAVLTGIVLTAAGSCLEQEDVRRRACKTLELLKISAIFESIGLIGRAEIEKQGIRPVVQEPFLFGFSKKEVLVIAASALLFTLAFIFKDRLQLVMVTVGIFVLMGGMGVILHELAHHAAARHYCCISELRFWALGTGIMFLTAGLFGSVFARPSRTLVSSPAPLIPGTMARLTLAGPAMSFAIALLSLPLIPLGGLFAAAGQVGFSINLLICTFSLVPFAPMKGKILYTWNRLVWGTIFLPLLALFLYVNMA